MAVHLTRTDCEGS